MMYKNWFEISKITDINFKLAMCTLDLSTDFGQEIAFSLSRYFTDSETPLRVPISVLMRLAAIRLAQEDGYSSNIQMLPNLWDDYTLQSCGIPSVFCSADPQTLTEEGVLPIPIPEIECERLNFGDVIEWRDSKWILVTPRSEIPYAFLLVPFDAVELDILLEAWQEGGTRRD